MAEPEQKHITELFIVELSKEEIVALSMLILNNMTDLHAEAQNPVLPEKKREVATSYRNLLVSVFTKCSGKISYKR